MTKLERDKLREIALANPQGRWTAGYSKEDDCIYATVDSTDWEHPLIATCGVYDAHKSRSVALAKYNKRARYIAAARPEVVLRLLDMVDSLEMAITQKCEDCPGKKAGMCEGCALEGHHD